MQLGLGGAENLRPVNFKLGRYKEQNKCRIQSSD